MNFTKDISIDRGSLHLEFEKQGDLMFSYSELLAHAEKKVNDLKDDVNYQKELNEANRSNISLKYRSGEIDAGVKITEGALLELLNTNKEVQDNQAVYYSKKKELNEAIAKRDTIYGMVEALRHKKTSLENLSTLYLANYFSQPKEKSTDEIRNSQRLKLNRSKNDD